MILRGIAVLCIVGCIVLLRVTERYKLTATVSAEQARWLILKDNLVSAAVVVLGLVAVWLFGSKMFAKVLAHFYFFLYLVLVIVIYISWVYPNLPQEFGGVRPRCGYVNVVRDQISEPLQKQILPESTVPSKAAVQRSVRLQVFFSGSEFMLVKPDPQNSTAGSGPSLVELKKTAIQAIEWCD